MEFLSNLGISDNLLSTSTLFLIAVVVVLVYILQVLTRRILTAVLERTSKVKIVFLQCILMEVPHYIAMIVPLVYKRIDT